MESGRRTDETRPRSPTRRVFNPRTPFIRYQPFRSGRPSHRLTRYERVVSRDKLHTYSTAQCAYKFCGGIKINQNSSGHNSSSGDINATADHSLGASYVHACNAADKDGAHTGPNREKGREERSWGEAVEPRDVFSQMRSDTAKALPARNFIDDEICNRCDLPTRYVPSIIYK